VDQTYKIIGGDGQEYGPVSLLELKNWIVSGRVAALTQVWSSESMRWIPAVQYSELQPEIGQVAAQSAQLERSIFLVGFWPRLGAYIVDVLVLYVLCYLVLGPFTVPAPTTFDLPSLIEYWQASQPRIFWEIGLNMIYTVFMTGQIGATVGKLLIGARIIRMDGSKIGFGVALVRWFGSLLSSLLLGIGYLFIAFRRDRRALHDLVAGTQVIYGQPRPESES
jgi:uncharacterized RDD family membrane protein YckC